MKSINKSKIGIATFLLLFLMQPVYESSSRVSNHETPIYFGDQLQPVDGLKIWVLDKEIKELKDSKNELETLLYELKNKRS